jgi:hypothetical protein
MGLEVTDSMLFGENMILFFLRIEVGGVCSIEDVTICSISLVGIEISIFLNRSVVFATDWSDEETEDDDEEADEDESLATGFLDKDAGLSFFRRAR